MTDIDALLALDTTDPASALAFRRGVAELAGHHFAVDPFYDQSVDAALTLPLYGTLFYLHRAVAGWLCAIDWRDDNFNLMRVDETADTPALAICRAWLRYRAAQSTPVATARDEEA